MKTLSGLAALAWLLTFSSSANADVYTYSGDITLAPTFLRPFGFGLGEEPHYRSFEFAVGQSGIYSLVSITPRYDGYTYLYQDFDPRLPLTGLLAQDDHSISVGRSEITFALKAGTSYTYVNTGWTASDKGVFFSTIEGPGAIAAIPEPATYMMLLAGLGLAGFASRRKLRSAR